MSSTVTGRTNGAATGTPELVLAASRAFDSRRYEEALRLLDPILTAAVQPTDRDRADLYRLQALSLLAVNGVTVADSIQPLTLAFNFYAQHGLIADAVDLLCSPLFIGKRCAVDVDVLVEQALAFDVTDSDRARLLATRGLLAYHRGADPGLCLAFLDESWDLARRPADRPIKVRVHVTRAHIAAWELDFQRCRIEADAGLALSWPEDEPLIELWLRHQQVIAALASGDSAAARNHSSAALPLAEQHRDRDVSAYAYMNAITAAILAGDFERAEALLTRGLVISPSAAVLRLQAARLAWERGERSKANTMLSSALAGRSSRSAPAGGGSGIALILLPAALLANDLGDARVVADGSTVQVFYAPWAGKVLRMPDGLLEQMERFEGRPLPTRATQARQQG